MSTLLFVYGTLKSGHARFHVLSNQRYIGIAKTTDDYAMFSLEKYPGLVDATKNMAGKKIYGELYEVDESCLKELDIIEGVEYNLFSRKEIILDEVTIVNLPRLHETFAKLHRKIAEAYFFEQSVNNLKDAGIFWSLD